MENKLVSILRNAAIAQKTILYSLIFFILFGVGVALIPNPIFLRMMPSNIFDYIFLATTSLLSGIYYSIPEKKTCKMDKVSFGGALLGFLAFGCPTCNKLLVILLGYTALFTIFDPLRPIIGFLSIITLAYAINKKIE